MAANAWYRSGTGLFLTSVVLPPIAIVLVWLQPAHGFVRKSLRTLALSLWTVLLAGFLLVRFAGLQVEVDGTGTRPVFSFYNPESHYEEIERMRASQEIPPPLEEIADEDGAAPGPAALAAGTVGGEGDPRDPPGKGYWTDFRGPKRDGCYGQAPILTDWPGGRLDELWRQEIGENYASVVVADSRLFTIEQRRDREVVACYDFKTGREIWEHGWKAHFSESMGGDGPRATPTWHEGKIYALGASGELQAIHAKKGKSIWRRNILSDNGARNLTWAMSASPLIVDDKVIVLPGGQDGKSVVAYHKDTGEPVWSVLDDQQAYTSPSLATLGGQRQILVVSARRLMGLRPEDGELLWDFPWTTSYDANIAQPLAVDESHVFISAGYGHGAALVKITASGGEFSAAEVWHNNRMKTKFNSPVLYEDHVYGLDEGMLECINVRTGDEKWKGGRYGYGQVILADGHIILTTEQGEVVLVKATPEGHQEKARFSALSGKTWNTPAIADGRLIVLNQTEMACYRLAGK